MVLNSSTITGREINAVLPWQIDYWCWYHFYIIFDMAVYGNLNSIIKVISIMILETYIGRKRKGLRIVLLKYSNWNCLVDKIHVQSCFAYVFLFTSLCIISFRSFFFIFLKKTHLNLVIITCNREHIIFY